MRLIPYYKIVFLLLCCFVTGIVRAQNTTPSPLTFEQVEWNFGDIAEDGGTVEHTFTFINNTSKPVVILDVTTGCGCTTTSYSRKPIMRGERGEVTVVFNPMNLPGRVTKSASILTSASSKPFVVTMQGNVIPRKKSVQEQYPIDLGDACGWSSTLTTLPMWVVARLSSRVLDGSIHLHVTLRLRFYPSRVAVCFMLMRPRHCEVENGARLHFVMLWIKIVRVTAR